MTKSDQFDEEPRPSFTFQGPVQGAVFNFGPQQGVVSTGDHAVIHQASAGIDLASASGSALRERRDALKAWAGGADRLSVAIVFTDIVDSSRLGNALGDHAWNEIRRGHFSRCEAVVAEHRGFLIKNLGDGVLAVFRDCASALDALLDLLADTGHTRVRLRAGLHVGEVSVENEDAFGSQVNLAARVMAHAPDGGIRVSDPVKRAVTAMGNPAHSGLRWSDFSDVTLKGFPEAMTLWAVSK